VLYRQYAIRVLARLGVVCTRSWDSAVTVPIEGAQVNILTVFLAADWQTERLRSRFAAARLGSAQSHAEGKQRLADAQIIDRGNGR
jgi:hypothetical protein